MKKISAEKMSNVKNLLMTGMTGYEVAEKSGVSTATVNRARKELMREGKNLWHTDNWMDVMGY